MPRNKPAPKRLSGKISVLLVDDDVMARTAWRKVLGKSSQIQVIGEVVPGKLMREIRNISTPEVIVAGFSFVEKALVHSEKLINAWGNIPKTIIICENKTQVKAAYKSHANWAIASPFSDQDMVTWIRALSDDAKRLCSEYFVELNAIQKGNDQEQQFVKLIQEMLQLLFHPDLINPEKMDPSDATQLFPKGRLLFRNQARNDKALNNREIGKQTFDEFWKDARQNHDSKYIAMDIYNSEITSAAIQMLGKYLTPLHGSFGIIIGRGLVKTSLHPVTIALFENEKKAILLLGDAELQEMLEYKAGGVNPACLLQDLYQKLIADAEN